MVANNQSTPVAGSVYAATEDGFKKLLSESARVARDGYALVTIVPIENGAKIGAVYRRERLTTEPTGAFFT